MRNLEQVEKVLDAWVDDEEVKYSIRDAVKSVLANDDEEQAMKLAAHIIEQDKNKIRLDTIREVNDKHLVAKGVEIKGLSPFITESINDNGQILTRNNFIPYAPYNNSGSEEIKLLFDDLNGKWLLRKNNGPYRLVSRFVVEAGLIVDASASGSCHALVVFLKGSTKPLIFLNGMINSEELKKQTQFHQRGLSVRNRDYYRESFVRALCMCSNVFFLTLPKHAGWNTTPDGKRVFVSAENMIPILSDLFND